MCLTIGGVYATWQYAGTNDIADAFAETKVTIADAELTGANGTYKVESNLVLTVDQANTDHEAKLVFASNNDSAIFLKVTFTPAETAPKEIKENGVLSELYFDTTVPMQYRVGADGSFSKNAAPVDIFTFSNTANGSLDKPFTWTKEANGTFTYTLNQTDLEGMISLSQTFVLDTKHEHDVFGGHVEYDPEGHPGVKEGLVGNILVRVTDGTVN
ncbi:MAG: hypothetical protein E7340_06345 [Clostridiales bacterium]|nr:hypothetical protein [Clostridiales bacterium]